MADVAAKLYEGQPGTGDTLLYTDPGVSTLGTTVRGMEFANTTASPATITLGLNAGGALAAANQFAPTLTVPANGVLSWAGFQQLDSGGTIRALQGTSDAITVTISGVQL